MAMVSQKVTCSNYKEQKKNTGNIKNICHTTKRYTDEPKKLDMIKTETIPGFIKIKKMDAEVKIIISWIGGKKT